MNTKKFLRLFIALTLCVSTFVFSPATVLSVSAVKSQSQLNSEINNYKSKANSLKSQIADLKNKKASEAQIQKKLQEQVDNTQALINACNNQIEQYQSKINQNKKLIDEKNAEKDETIKTFKKRLRTIYMSNSGNYVQLLLGADSFADYLTLSELSKRTSEKDRAMVDSIVGLIDDINAAQKEMQADIDAQMEVKKTLASQRAELNTQLSQVNSVISDFNDDINKLNTDLKTYNNAINSLEADLDRYYNTDKNTTVKYDGSKFKWPVPGYYGVSSRYKWRWGRLHAGIDIWGSGINGARIVAAADGVVTAAGWNSGGYGNYVVINHGKDSSGNLYVTLYAHMSRVATSAGTSIKAGQLIGYVGNTGASQGAHCHFEVRINNSPVNPSGYFNNIKYYD